jgi:hypothetical protein
MLILNKGLRSDGELCQIPGLSMKYFIMCGTFIQWLSDEVILRLEY